MFGPQRTPREPGTTRRRGCDTAPVKVQQEVQQILFSQGFGSRRECVGLVLAGQVRCAGRLLDDPGELLDTPGLVLEVQGRAWPFHAKALVMLHKPAGYECSQKPRHHPSVMSLLPPPLRRRGVQPVGRLDEDTTGLLLLTDDGALIHRLTSPKHHVPKLYEVTARHPISDEQLVQLRTGVILDDGPRPVVPLAAERSGEFALALTLTEGRYHQVKRMLAAVGNRCEKLHRPRFGRLQLPDTLAPGQWCWVDAEP
jgi:16S rRNA pseudouridine516 synthase